MNKNCSEYCDGTVLQRSFDYFWSFFWEIFALIACILGLLAVFRRTNPKAIDPHPKRPILLIHGYLGHSTQWIFHRYFLEKANLGPVFTLNLGFPFRSIEEYASKVQTKAAEIAHLTGREDLSLVGHSMGGLVCGYYALHLASKGRVTHLITIGTPWGGSLLAPFGIGKCARQMRIDSPFLKSLNKNIFEDGTFSFSQMASRTDLIVHPYTRALVSTPRAQHTLFQRLGHLSFLFSKQVTKQIMTELKEPSKNKINHFER